MSYLLNKKLKRQKIFKNLSIAAVIFLIIFFRAPIFHGLSVFASTIFRPFILLKNGISTGLGNLGNDIRSKKSIVLENEDLKNQLEEEKLKSIERNILFDENVKLKEILHRKPAGMDLVLGVILSKPDASPYGTLIIDLGEDSGIKAGNLVYAYGSVPIGEISEVHAKSSIVKTFSVPGETIKVNVGGVNIHTDAVGRGGGNFEITLPREVAVAEGAELSLPGITSRIVAIVEKVISDPRDPFQKILAASPVNIQELKFIEVEK